MQTETGVTLLIKAIPQSEYDQLQIIAQEMHRRTGKKITISQLVRYGIKLVIKTGGK